MTEDLRIRSAITQVAAEWYAAHRVGRVSDADRAAFLAWLKASPLHIEEYLGVAALDRAMTDVSWDPAVSKEALIASARADSSANLLDYSSMAIPASPAAGVTMRLSGRHAFAAAGIAILALGAGLLASRWSGHGRPVEAKTYRTGHGEQSTEALADGSTLHMNTDTLVTVSFSAAERHIELDHGEVAVQVAHDARRALRVHAGTTNSTAIGTDFDVYRRADATLITVVSGRVAVSGDPPTAPRETHAPVQVGAGQQTDVVDGAAPPPPRAANLRETTAWLERKIVFQDRALGAVADDFNRYNDVVFSVDDSKLRDLKISGNFDAADVASFAAFLRSLSGVRVQRVADGFRVSSRPATAAAAASHHF